MSIELDEVISKAIEKVLETSPQIAENTNIQGYASLSESIKALTSSGVPLEMILAEAAIVAMRINQPQSNRITRQSLDYFVAQRRNEQLIYTLNSSVIWRLEPETVLKSLIAANEAIELFHDLSSLYGVELFQLLGLRNLSSFVGEVFAKQVRLSEPNRLISNPNQDGYPDLCALTPEGVQYIERNRNADGSIKRDKTLWSPYPYGGIEVKATCGNTPPASRVAKPTIGESRAPILQTAEWKAHHQQTRILLGVFWDFVDGLPTVLATFFRNDLDTTVGKINTDWGAVIMPTEEGGRTTSVSIMKQQGVKKMGAGWMVLPRNENLLAPLARVFGIMLPLN
jgi:hypothetical protein